MALDANLLFRGLQAGLAPVAPVANLLQGAQTGQQLMRGNLQNQMLQQQMQQDQALAPLQQRALEQNLAQQEALNPLEQQLAAQNVQKGDLTNQILQENLDALGVPDVPTAKEVALNTARVAALPTVEAKIEALGNIKANAVKSGRTTENVDELLAAYAQDPKLGEQMLSAGIQAFEKAGFLSPSAARQPMQKAEAGMVFNPNTGTFSVDPIAKARLDELAELKANQNVDLSAKDRQSISKDITGMIKDTVGIRNTAQDLERLGKIGGGPSAIAMVYKFMKALDPASVVREGEFATAESASGVPTQVANIYNKLVTGERLDDTQVKSFVNTAKELANSAIDSSSAEVNKYLDTFEESIPGSFIEKTKSRLPSRFDVPNQKNRIRFDAQGNIIK